MGSRCSYMWSHLIPVMIGKIRYHFPHFTSEDMAGLVATWLNDLNQQGTSKNDTSNKAMGLPCPHFSNYTGCLRQAVWVEGLKKKTPHTNRIEYEGRGRERGEQKCCKTPIKANMKDEARGSICWEDWEGVRKNEKEFQISGVRDGSLKGTLKGNKLHR